METTLNYWDKTIILQHHDDYLVKWYKENNRFYESEFLEYSLKRMQGREWVIYDVWANIWNHTLFRLMNWHDVISFEPSKDNFELLRNNILQSQKDLQKEQNSLQVVIHKQALSNGQYNYSIESNMKNRWNDTVSITKAESESKTIMLDEYSQPCKLIKIDVEWMELEVLQWALITIQRFLPDIMVEINNNMVIRYLENLWYVRSSSREKSKTIYFVHRVYAW